MVLCRPQKKRRTRFLRSLTEVLRKVRHVPIREVVQKVVNPRVRGWVNYFRWGNAARDLSFVGWQVHQKVCRFASRQRPKKRKGEVCWTTWRPETVYGDWGLYNQYRVAREQRVERPSPITLVSESTGNAGWRKSPCPV